MEEKIEKILSKYPVPVYCWDSMIKKLSTLIQTERKEAEEDGRNKLTCQILEGVTTAQEVFLNMIKDILKESEK